MAPDRLEHLLLPELSLAFLSGSQTLSRSRLRDLTVAEPDLEEIFLHYYQDGGENP